MDQADTCWHIHDCPFWLCWSQWQKNQRQNFRGSIAGFCQVWTDVQQWNSFHDFAWICCPFWSVSYCSSCPWIWSQSFCLFNTALKPLFGVMLQKTHYRHHPLEVIFSSTPHEVIFSSTPMAYHQDVLQGHFQCFFLWIDGLGSLLPAGNMSSQLSWWFDSCVQVAPRSCVVSPLILMGATYAWVT